jgi:predicted dehydrogenase
MKNICIIGVGNLGYRHYQALLKIDFDTAVYLVDPNIRTIESTIQGTRYSNPNIKSVRLLTTINELPDSIDLAIIATNSDVRASVTKQLVKSKRVLYILFEKVLFQKMEDYQLIRGILTGNGIKAWVNCPLRMYPYYQEIRKDIDSKPVRCKVNGWDLACNSIHFVDLVEWLSGGKLDHIVTNNLGNLIIESKRKGFIEITGELVCQFNDGSSLSMTSIPGAEVARCIEIRSENCNFEINELDNRCKKIYDNQIEEREIRPLYQSELTNLVAKKIIFHQKCELVTYNDSMQQHTKLIEAFKKHIENINVEYIIEGSVPVT